MKKISIESDMSKDEQKYINDQLQRFNVTNAPHNKESEVKDVHLILKDEDKNIYGGLLGKIYRHCLVIETLWINKEVRKLGYGTELLMMAEHAARTENCRFIHLDTFSFQAPEFYRKNGYIIFGILDDYADGIKRYYLKKNI